MEDNAQPATPQQVDTHYLAIVGILMLMIIGLLAWLWVQERSRRTQAEVALQQAHQQISGLQMVLSQFPAGGGPGGVQPVQRQDLPAEAVTLNGEALTALRISAAAGERFGFAPGDVVIVSPAVAVATPQPEPTTRQDAPPADSADSEDGLAD